MIERRAEREAVVERFGYEADFGKDEEPEDTDGEFVIPAGEWKRWWRVCEALNRSL